MFHLELDPDNKHADSVLEVGLLHCICTSGCVYGTIVIF